MYLLKKTHYFTGQNYQTWEENRSIKDMEYAKEEESTWMNYN
jgi:CRISPR/Cas system CMR-associated protein Cmr1 (group 7 of RAMP superfamily)